MGFLKLIGRRGDNKKAAAARSLGERRGQQLKSSSCHVVKSTEDVDKGNNKKVDNYSTSSHHASEKPARHVKPSSSTTTRSVSPENNIIHEKTNGNNIDDNKTTHSEKPYRIRDEDEVILIRPSPLTPQVSNGSSSALDSSGSFASKYSWTSKRSHKSGNHNGDQGSIVSKHTKTSKHNVAGVSSSFHTKTSANSVSSGSTATTKTYRYKDHDSIPIEIVPKARFLVRNIKALVDQLNNVTTADDILQYFCPGALFIPEDVSPIPMTILAGVNVHLHMSFPDMEFAYESIKQEGINTVVVEGAQFSGTHIGEPYTAMPGKLPALPPSGTHVLVDKERWFFEMEGELIKSWVVVALGPVTGPAGVYEMLGGSLKPSKPRRPSVSPAA